MATARVESGVAQPDLLPVFRFFYDGVQIFEAGDILSPTTIVQTGNTFAFRQELGFDGILAPLILGQLFNGFVHIERLEDGFRDTLPVGNFVAAAPLAHIQVTSGFFAAGVAPFDIPAGFDAGTFRLMFHWHADDAAIRPLVTAYHDGLVLLIS